MKKSKHTIFHWFLVVVRSLVKDVILLAFWTTVLLSGIVFYSVFNYPLNLIIAVPLMITAVGMGTSNLYEMFASVTSQVYSQGHCPICEPSKEAKRILSPKDGIID